MIVRAISLGCSRWRPANVIAIGASASDVNDEPIASSSTASRKYDDNGVSGVTVSQHGVTRKNMPTPSSSPAADSRSTPNGAPVTWGRTGIWPRFAAPRTTPATATRWRSTPAPAPPAPGRAATLSGGERNAPGFGDLAVGDGFQKHSYPFGILVNAQGRPFVDEGAEFRNYTYAKYGRRILEQPGQFAWQVFDQKVTHLLRDEYKIREVTKVTAPTAKALAHKLEGVDPAGFLEEIKAYNAAVDTATEFNPNVKDGPATSGLPVNKTNWANTLDEAVRSRPTRSPAASRLPSAGCGSTPMRRSSTPTSSRFRVSTRRAKSSVASSISTTPVAPD